MILYLSLMALLIAPELQTNQMSLSEVRNFYSQAADNESVCKMLLDKLPSYTDTDNTTFEAYRASTTMVMASHVWNPVDKMSYFNNGKEQLNRVLKSDKENIEIRFLRFTIQSQAPVFLGYNKSLSKDKTFLITALENMNDQELRKIIVTYLKSSDELTTEEKHRIEL